MPDPTLLKIVTAVNAGMVLVVGLVIFVLAVLLAGALFWLWRMVRHLSAKGQIVEEAPEIVEGQFVPVRALVIIQREMARPTPGN